MSSAQLSFDALLEVRELELAVAEEGIRALSVAGLDHAPPDFFDDLDESETSPSWVGQLIGELRRIQQRAADDVPRLRRLLARLVHENVDVWLQEREAHAHHERMRPPARVDQGCTTTVPAPRRPKPALPRSPKPEALELTKKLTDRQRELLQVIAVGADNIGRFESKEHVHDWPALKEVMVALGSRWKTKTGFAFPDDIDGTEVVRIALETGTIIDWAGAGFFPTPDPLADALVARLVDLPESPHILEPSAGTGALILAIKRRYPFAQFYAMELIDQNRDVLEKMRVSLIGRDWLTSQDDIGGEDIHAIAMNPPFAGRADVRHITKAIDFLNPGGQLVAIASAGVKYRDDKLARDFRALVAAHDGVIEDNPEGSFKASGTGVRTVSIYLRKGGS